MECKYERGIYETGGKKELIDTLWNVNHSAFANSAILL